tara:strand:- start:10692 stop:10952 length:261 start_codon:yes stop_codon:yes gene_type:complete
MNYSNRTYAYANTSTIGNVDFTQVMEKSADTVRKSIDKTQFILKWYTEKEPTFITNNSVTLTWRGSHSDSSTKLTSSFWTDTGSMP